MASPAITEFQEEQIQLLKDQIALQNESIILQQENKTSIQNLEWAGAFFIGIYVFFVCFRTLKTYVL